MKNNAPIRHGLRLYVAGSTAKSLRAVECITNLFEQHFPGRYHLEIVDVYKQPSRAVLDQIVAIPTLVQYAPGGMKRLIGDMSQITQVRKELGLIPVEG